MALDMVYEQLAGHLCTVTSSEQAEQNGCI